MSIAKSPPPGSLLSRVAGVQHRTDSTKNIWHTGTGTGKGLGATIKSPLSYTPSMPDRELFEGIRGAQTLLERADRNGVIPTVTSPAIERINAMTGISGAKAQFQTIADALLAPQGHQILEKATTPVNYSMMFLKGPDGVGKAAFAQHLGALFREREYFTEFDAAQPATLRVTAASISSAGEKSTLSIIERARNSVLYIDELDGFSGATGKSSLQAIRNYLRENPKDLSVVFGGTKEEVEALAKVDGRFDTSLGINVGFEHFTDLEIGQEAVRYAQSMGYRVGRKSVAHIVETLSQRRESGHFNNALTIAATVDKAIVARGASATVDGRNAVEVTEQGFVDLLPKDFGVTGEKKKTPLEVIEHRLVGNEGVKSKLREIDTTIEKMISENHDVPWETLRPQVMQAIDPVFILTGEPGLGKTTLARLLGAYFKEKKLLPNGDKFVEVGTSDVVSQYISGTAIKVRELFDKSRGGVLFFNEAYAILGGGYLGEGGKDRGNPHGKEALDEVNRLMTHEDYMGKQVLVFDGYKEKMQEFLQANPGLVSRVKHNFEMERPDQAGRIDIFGRKAEAAGITLTDDALAPLVNALDAISEHGGYANGRTIESLYTVAFRRSIVNGNYAKRQMTGQDITEAMESSMQLLESLKPS